MIARVALVVAAVLAVLAALAWGVLVMLARYGKDAVAGRAQVGAVCVGDRWSDRRRRVLTEQVRSLRRAEASENLGRHQASGPTDTARGS